MDDCTLEPPLCGVASPRSRSPRPFRARLRPRRLAAHPAPRAGRRGTWEVSSASPAATPKAMCCSVALGDHQKKRTILDGAGQTHDCSRLLTIRHVADGDGASNTARSRVRSPMRKCTVFAQYIFRCDRRPQALIAGQTHDCSPFVASLTVIAPGIRTLAGALADEKSTVFAHYIFAAGGDHHL